MPTITTTQPKQIRLTFQHPKDKWDEFLGVKPTDESYDALVTESADVYTPEGELLMKFRKNAIDPGSIARAFPILRTIKTEIKQRGLAAGKSLITGVTTEPYMTKKGYVSRYRMVDHKAVHGSSSIIGFYDRYVRYPYCRQTAFNAKQAEKFLQVLPFLQSISKIYETEAPDRWALQKAVCDATHPNWTIPGTVFSTITVNQNWQTAVHTDQGDLKVGLSGITAIRAGSFTGCYLVFPHYRIAVDLQTADLLLFDSHHMHGNTPLIGKLNSFERVSLVLYVRENMRKCLSAAEELERAKNRKPGDSIW